MHIVQCLPCLYTGGVEQNTARLMRSLAPAHRSTLLAPEGPGSFIYSDAGITHQRFRKLEFDFVTGFSSLKNAIRSLDRNEKVDIVHARIESLLLPVVRAALPNVPRVFSTHGIWAASGLDAEARLKFRMTAWIINNWADAAYAVSHDQWKKLVKHGANPDKLNLIENGVPAPDASAIPRSQILEQFGFDPDKQIIIGALARLSKDKSLNTLIEAADILHSNHPELRYIIGGEGPEMAALARQIEKRGLKGIVVLAGFIKPAGDLLKCIDIYVQPSANEAFSLAILEAMAYSLPVVASDIGGIDEQVVQGKTGSLFTQGDPIALADALKPYVGSTSMRRAAGEAGSARYRQNFTQDIVAQKTEYLYEKTLSERSKKTTP